MHVLQKFGFCRQMAAAGALPILFSLCSCSFSGPAAVVPAESLPPAAEDAPGSAAHTPAAPPSKTLLPTDAPTQAPAESPSEIPAPVLTPKPAPEITVDGQGLTYVNGILIINKTYSLPRSYHPGTDSAALRAFEAMREAAAQEGISLEIVSGFRSYSTQEYLYYSYVEQDGVMKADTYSARPGHSEHQTGLAFDINDASDAFVGTPEALWLAAHCCEYGFIVRYPEGKQALTGFKYEPWHIRYLGIPLAEEVTESGLCLEEFLNITSCYSEQPV